MTGPFLEARRRELRPSQPIVTNIDELGGKTVAGLGHALVPRVVGHQRRYKQQIYQVNAT